MNPIELSLFSSRIEAICEEMGAVLQRSAFSTNIKDRLDFSCAIFDADGLLSAQAAHIPVHLGSMAYAMADIVKQIQWHDGDMIVVNDPFMGGTHLPDITVVAPLFIQQQLVGFITNRAHHANIGGNSPGSMPISRSLEEEGVIIPPTLLMREGNVDRVFIEQLLLQTDGGDSLEGDFTAQISANLTGKQRLKSLVEQMGVQPFHQALAALNDYAQRLVSSVIHSIPSGTYQFSDYLDDDGCGNSDLVISTSIQIKDDKVHVDFTGTAPQTTGNVNAPLSVAAAAVFYVFRCLMPDHTPACAGAFRPITIHAPEGSLLNARRPAAVAAGNVETSTRVVDVICGALAPAIPDRIPAASHGSMNNLAMGSRDNNNRWDYYETIGGGMGAGKDGGGLSAVQTHMTNTLNTPVEVLEMNYPVRVCRYALRRGTGGKGQRDGGDGILREYEFLKAAQITLLTERRNYQPWGLNGGQSGKAGINHHNDDTLPPKVSLKVDAGDRVLIETPGGGGFGDPTVQKHPGES
jgi:N-methylhydantoinase B